MTTLYSAAVTIKGKKRKAVSFEVNYTEREALRSLAASIVALNALKPAAHDLRCGVRMSKVWCTTVAEGLSDLMGLGVEEVLTVGPGHLKDLRTINAQLTAMLKGTTAKTKALEINSDTIKLLVAAGDILTAYKDDQVDVIGIGEGEITRARIVEAVEFLQGVHRNILIK